MSETTPAPVAETYLHYQDTGSNKGYMSCVRASAAGWVHATAWGGVGKSFQNGEKTYPTREKAEAEHEKVVKSKVAKGYRPCAAALLGFTSESGGALPALVVKEIEWVPMLFSACDRARALALIEDDGYFAQRKMDGERRRLRSEAGEVFGYNRRGIQVPVPGILRTALLNLPSAAIDLDGEVIGNDQFHAFDCLDEPGVVAAARALYLLRLDLCQTEGPIREVPTAFDTAGKRALLEQALAEGWEGLVFKRQDQPYFPGRSRSDYKLKLWNNVTVYLVGVNRTDKREYGSFQMAVPSGNGDLIRIGNVSSGFSDEKRRVLGRLINEGHRVMVEIRYLYYDLAALYQPCYQGPRTDLTDADLVGQAIWGEDGRQVTL